MKYDAIVVGAGLAGLVTVCEMAVRGKNVLLLDQEPVSSIGGQAWWSFGGLFLVDSPEQRNMKIKDSLELAKQDWYGSATYDNIDGDDHWGSKWADAYLAFANGEKREWLKQQGIHFFPVVGWAERGGYLAEGHGNSVPRFHIVWGTGPAIVEPFARKLITYIKNKQVTYKPRHQVNDLITEEGSIVGVKGNVLAPSDAKRGEKSNRDPISTFAYFAEHTVIASGGIGANANLIKQHWPHRLGKAPDKMLTGVPDHVDGRMIGISENRGASVVNKDRMWHYTEGIKNHSPVWTNHGIRILPGPSSIWLDAKGNRFPVPYLPGFDTLGTLEAIMKTNYDYSWFILTQEVIEKEFALSGSEQNPDLTEKDFKKLLTRLRSGATQPVQKFIDDGEDFVQAETIEELVEKMNRLTNENLLDLDKVKNVVEARDREMDNTFTKDLQITAIRGSRNYLGDKLIRTAKPHKFLDQKHGPLIAVKLNIISRKTLGGLQTNLNGEVLKENGDVLKGLYAVGEASGFGGGGIHGYRSLEGTFLGSCLFTGKRVGEYIGKL
ncbi:FAD-binding dehydrogenase [Halalkalibacillus halophilus]|uniref:FAD-binding dehydrogenase n=1 Tax=Halalkalibacillus halophilus TaxID=392827 RepID=UPI0004090A1D|nr:FAD-binding dehydrogenase [Halalkalibacillus halophilus]